MFCRCFHDLCSSLFEWWQKLKLMVMSVDMFTSIFFWVCCPGTCRSFLLLSKIHLHHSSQITNYKLWRSQKTVEIKVFLLFLLDDGRTWIRIQIPTGTSDWRIRIREAQKLPDPEHCHGLNEYPHHLKYLHFNWFRHINLWRNNAPKNL
jgi:hypothetical protein